ncbi:MULTISPECIES: hypothetical protein [Bacillus cereus group]|uniref:hypothetical protein n=1 Tax=Bacillus cereus group TaxID=86661 RepID=UPI000470ECA8|nr:hypothetical protein [Bacillus cereus]MDA2445424.1 hypothetical protein [Bacillus cereus]HDR6217335.1 hypothetical protein [Bacillus cereus]HDR6219696.1 hypothetical protein [Bacillus cereus]HDR6956426.1 hypothetical protein [Bacillus cereus]
MVKFDRDYVQSHLGLEDLSTIILQEAMNQLGDKSLEKVQFTANINVYPTERSCVGYCIGIGSHPVICVHKVNEQ